MKSLRKLREKVRLYRKIQELGFSRFESKYFVNKAYSCKGKLFSKDVALSFSMYNTEKKRSKDEKINYIKGMFPESDLLSKLIKLEIPEQDIKKYLKIYLHSSSKNNKSPLEKAV